MPTRFWTVAVPAAAVPQPGSPVEVMRSETGSGYDAWCHGLCMPIEAVTEIGEQTGRHSVAPDETSGTIGLIAPLHGSLAVMRIDRQPLPADPPPAASNARTIEPASAIRPAQNAGREALRLPCRP